jgi:hypothetical protein
MKENQMDVVKSGVMDRMGQARQAFGETWKNTKPFNKEPVDDYFLEYIYDNMSIEDMNYAIQTYGPDAVNQRISEIEMRKAKRKGVQ